MRIRDCSIPEFDGIVGKEVVLQEYGNLHQQFCVDAGLVEDAVGIAALVADGFGKVFHRPPLFFETVVNQFSDGFHTLPSVATSLWPHYKDLGDAGLSLTRTGHSQKLAIFKD